MMLYFKSCLRCKDGTVELGSDNFGSFLICLTCGYTINSRSIRANGKIEQPATLEEDVVMAPQLEPVSIFDENLESEYEPEIDLAEVENLIESDEIDLEEAAV